MRWWTLELDIALRDSVVAGKAWLGIAASLHMTRDQVARRASRLGLKRGMSFQDAARRIREWDKRRKDIRAPHVQRFLRRAATRQHAVLRALLRNCLYETL